MHEGFLWPGQMDQLKAQLNSAQHKSELKSMESYVHQQVEREREASRLQQKCEQLTAKCTKVTYICVHSRLHCCTVC